MLTNHIVCFRCTRDARGLLSVFYVYQIKKNTKSLLILLFHISKSPVVYYKIDMLVKFIVLFW